MKSLYDLINEQLDNLDNVDKKFKKLDFFINDDKNSAEFINLMTSDNEYNTPNRGDPLYSVAQGRARHSAITYLSGLILMKFQELFKCISSDQEYMNKLWLMTSLNHDLGYMSEYITYGGLIYRDKFKNYLFDDGKNKLLYQYQYALSDCMAYTYKEIENYDKYSRWYHQKNSDIERLDHGILGGIILYNKQVKTFVDLNRNDNIDLAIIKNSALTISQHNIYKSSNLDSDKDYLRFDLNRLTSTSDYKIGMKTPLLLLLCLVDTIECVKKYSRKENSGKYMRTLTILKNIMFDVTEKEIKIDYSKLAEKERKHYKKEEIYYKIIEDINGLNSWTCLNVTQKGLEISITLEERR